MPASYPKSVLQNRQSFTVDQKRVAVPGTAEQLPSITVPKGFQVAIVGLPTNTGNIYFGETKTKAENHTQAKILPKGIGVGLLVNNTDAGWIDADVANEGVDIIVEQ